MKQTHSFCCFNSRLGRLINEQGRAKLGRCWGTAQQPDCSGFTVTELQALDFARMDLFEFYAEIAPTLPNAQDAVNRIGNRVPQCYFGQGQYQDSSASTKRAPPGRTLRANMVERRFNVHRSEQIGNIGVTMRAIEMNRDHRCGR